MTPPGVQTSATLFKVAALPPRRLPPVGVCGLQSVPVRRAACLCPIAEDRRASRDRLFWQVLDCGRFSRAMGPRFWLNPLDGQ
jgi:hypothetical protein